MRRIRHFLEYLLVRLLFGLLSLLPRRWGVRVGRGFGRLTGTLFLHRRRLATANMKQVFPEVSLFQIEKWVWACWENLGQAMWEFTRIPRLSREEYFDWVTVEGVEHLQRSFEQKKGVILFTAHYTNWELTSQFVVFSGFPLAVIARRMKNPYVNDFVSRIRSHLNIRVFMHKQAVRESLRWLKQGNVLGLLIDQRITDGGIKVPFLGRPAYTTSMPALLALRVGSPVHPVHCWREKGAFRLRVAPALDVSGFGTSEEDIVRLTAQMTRVVEGWVRERPPLWLWIHDRWKL